MFFTPLLIGWLQPYAAHFFSSLDSGSMIPVIVFDLMFASSFVVLGAEFWDKIQSLFVHGSGVSSHTEHSSTDSSQGETR
jgi:hypothetical protein